MFLILVLSFLISTLFIKNYNQLVTFTCDEIFLIMSIPGFDLLRLAITRTCKKQHPFKADNLHIHHLAIKKFFKFIEKFRI